MEKLIYLDNAATTALKPEVFEAMKPYFLENYSNPNSVYTFAQQSKKAVEENLDTPKKKKLSIAAILDFITGCVTPIIPVLMAGGFIKMVAILGEQFGFLAAGTPTHTVLTFAGDAAFYFLPVFVGATTAKKAGGNQLLGMIFGVSIPLRTPLYGGMIGTLFGGAIAGFLKAHAYVMTGAPGLLGGLPIYLGGGMGNFINMCIAVGVGMVITFIATMLLYKEPADTQV